MRTFLGFSTFIILSLQCVKLSKPDSRNDECGTLNEKYLYKRDNKLEHDEHPWMALVLYEDEISKSLREPKCVAVLISNRHLVSAAHCFYESSTGIRRNNAVAVVLGDCGVKAECVRQQQEHELTEIAIHPRFDHRKHVHDIALLTIARNVTVTNYVRPICLPSSPKSYVAQYFHFVGFTRDLVKRKALTQTTTTEHCLDLFKRFLTIENNICGYILFNDNDIPVPLSGSALVGINIKNNRPASFYLIGMANAGAVTNDLPTVFTLIDLYRTWIAENMVWS